MFASKTPRDLNHDPAPFVYKGERYEIAGVDLRIHGVNQRYTEKVELDPRPEFDHVQHNEPNPILALWRETSDGDMRGWGVWLALAAHDMMKDGQATADHKVHARRVLTRLAEIGA